MAAYRRSRPTVSALASYNTDEDTYRNVKGDDRG